MLALVALVAAVETTPSRAALHDACYGAGGATQECVSVLAQAIIGHSKKCYEKHHEREAYTACASTFCFSECGEYEDCSELCDEKAKQAFDFFAGTPTRDESFTQKSVHSKKNDFFGNAVEGTDPAAGVAGIPSRADLQAACYGGAGATGECTALLARAIIGHSKKCYEKHKEREAYTSCASTFCFSECGENEDCSELCDSKAKQAFDFFSGSKAESDESADESFVATATTSKRVRHATPKAATRDAVLDYVSLAQRGSRRYLRRGAPVQGKVDHHKCRVLCQRFMMKALGPAFEDVEHPNECMNKCDEVCQPACPEAVP